MRSLVLVGLLVAVSGVGAGPPETLGVQGRLELSNGDPVVGAQDLLIRVYDAASGGDLLYAEEESVVFDADGVFATELGDKIPSDPPAPFTTLAFDVPYYLEMSIDSGATILEPRLPLLAGPYARRAHVADRLPRSGPGRIVRVPPVVSAGVIDPTSSGAALEAALASITDASASAPYVVELGAGEYHVGADLDLVAHVTLRGAGQDATVIQATGSGVGTPLVRSADRAHLSRLTIRLDGSGVVSGYLHRSAHVATLDRVTIDLGSERRWCIELDSNPANVLELRGVTLIIAGSIGSAAGIRFGGGTLRVLDSLVEIQNTDGDAMGLDNASGEVLHVAGSTFDVATSGASSQATGIEATVSLGATISGSRVTASGRSATAIAIAANDESSVTGNAGRAVGTSGSTYGLTVTSGAGRAAITGNSLHSSTDSGTAYGLRSSASSAKLVASGNSIRSASTSGISYGIYLTGGGALGSGNQVEVAGSSSTTYGMRSSSGARFTGNDVEVLAPGGTTYGAYSASSLGIDLSGDELRVSGGSGQVYGVWSTGDAHITGCRIDVDGTGGTPTGVHVVDDSFLVSGTRLDVDSTAGSGVDVIGFHAQPVNSSIKSSVVGSHVRLTASGTSYLADNVDDLSKNPDLHVYTTLISASSRGANVTCTDSPGCP